MAAKVFFADQRESLQGNMAHKLATLWRALDGDAATGKGKLVAIKLHFGEQGNAAYVHPTYVRAIVDLVRAAGGRPFLTDSSTIYKGTRSDAVNHLETAIRNGFTTSVVNAPVVIADGLRGGSVATLPVANGKHYREAGVGAEAAAADALVVITHFKGHEVTGFGGSIKNLGMGLAAKPYKLSMHSTMTPQVSAEDCVRCGICGAHCAHHAITVGKKQAEISAEKCVGCGQCLIACPTGAIGLAWNGDPSALQEKMAEIAQAVTAGKPVLYFNFLLKVSPDCDCYGFNDTPVVPDLGVLASRDCVAVDQACYDMVNAAEGNPLSRRPVPAGADKFRALFPQIDATVQLRHGEQVGLGSRQYELVHAGQE